MAAAAAMLRGEFTYVKKSLLLLIHNLIMSMSCLHSRQTYSV